MSEEQTKTKSRGNPALKAFNFFIPISIFAFAAIWERAGELTPLELQKKCAPLVEKALANSGETNPQYSILIHGPGKSTHELPVTTSALRNTRDLFIRSNKEETSGKLLFVCSNSPLGVKLSVQ